VIKLNENNDEKNKDIIDIDVVEIKEETTQAEDAIDKSSMKKNKEKDNNKHVTRKYMRNIVVVSCIASLLFGFGGGILADAIVDNDTTNATGVLYQTVSRTTNDEESDSLGLSTADVVAAVADSVVEIQTESATYDRMMGQSVIEGAGSGVIVTTDGYIVTNNHVIEDANKITVITTDEKEYEATVVGTDETTDIAVLKIDAADLTPAVLGNSSDLSVGDTAITIGNPLGELGGTITEGIISALDREITVDGETMNLLQTDAAINPGNSGGGLFDDNAELVGIIVAKSISTEVEGLGFAIPIDDVKTVIEDLINDGSVSGRVYVGISAIDISDSDIAAQYNLNKTGVYITEVQDNTSADQAGLEKGDLIIGVGGKEINSMSDFKEIINSHEVDDKVEFTVLRDNNIITIQVTLGEK
jgi:serine protease Do